MGDQAEDLRALAARRFFGVPIVEEPAVARVISVTSGKGGVGKTNFVCSLAIGLAQLGKRVVILDADLGLANVDVLLGVYSKFNLRHVITGECTLNDVMVKGPFGIRIIPGVSGIQTLADLPASRRANVISALDELMEQFDFILIDTGAGISSRVMDFVLASPEIIVITTPEPTAIADAYAIIKIITKGGYGERIKVVINMAESEKEAEYAEGHLRRVSNEFLGSDINVLGYILFDKTVPASVREQSAFVVKAPFSKASASVLKMSRDLTGKEEKKKVSAQERTRNFFAKLMDRNGN